MTYKQPDVWRGWWKAWWRQMQGIVVEQTPTATYYVNGQIIDPEREVA